MSAPDEPAAATPAIRPGGTAPDRTVDAIGLLCPLPVLKARKALAAMTPGQILEIRASDPMAKVDIPHMAREDGHDLLATEEMPEGNVMRFTLRRGTAP